MLGETAVQLGREARVGTDFGEIVRANAKQARGLFGDGRFADSRHTDQ